MPHHAETRILPYSPRQLYDLVADIERYPEFLPWCRAAQIHERKGNVLKADLVIGYKAFHETFTSIVTLLPSKKITVEYGGGPLTHLENIWTFAPSGKQDCELGFVVDFDFRSSLLSGLIAVFFDRAFIKMVNAFEERARQLYGT